jgi:hypothetical protein
VDLPQRRATRVLAWKCGELQPMPDDVLQSRAGAIGLWGSVYGLADEVALVEIALGGRSGA